MRVVWIDSEQLSHLLCNLTNIYLHEGVGSETHTGLKLIKIIQSALKLLSKIRQEVIIRLYMQRTPAATAWFFNTITTEGK